MCLFLDVTFSYNVSLENHQKSLPPKSNNIFRQERRCSNAAFCTRRVDSLDYAGNEGGIFFSTTTWRTSGIFHDGSWWVFKKE